MGRKFETYEHRLNTDTKPYFKKVGCSICHDKTCKTVIEKVEEISWFRGDDIITWTCLKCHAKQNKQERVEK